ncbi:hypothetical protein FB45DRAFT_785517 [Roridomyces roridus]|uniref:Polyketide cyclase/dehydrase n=1 Tax=Roridomyces roridus TaxID=1738132 RepID=A0AAD7FWL0_9AGAR|nr:hypothetical protein FB45DRAFT_785517 [Roridomyces roridus]
MSLAKSIPLKSDWPFYFSTSVVINAPRQQVWDVLLHFGGHKSWNPFIREATPVLDRSQTPLPTGTALAPGHHIAMKVHIPGTMDDSVKPRAMIELVKQVEAPSQLAWGSHLPGWFFGAENWHVLTELEGGAKTKFEIVAVFKGVGPRVMMWTMDGAILDETIKGMAEGLKRVCEQR